MLCNSLSFFGINRLSKALVALLNPIRAEPGAIFDIYLTLFVISIYGFHPFLIRVLLTRLLMPFESLLYLFNILALAPNQPALPAPAERMNLCFAFFRSCVGGIGLFHSIFRSLLFETFFIPTPKPQNPKEDRNIIK